MFSSAHTMLAVIALILFVVAMIPFPSNPSIHLIAVAGILLAIAELVR